MDHDVFMDQMEDPSREEFAKALKALEEAPMDIGALASIEKTF